MRYISIRDKLILNYVIIGMITIFVIGTFSYYTARKAIFNRTFDQLNSVRVFKREQLENFFLERSRDAKLLASSEDSRKILQKLNKGSYPEIRSGKPYFNQGLVDYYKNIGYYNNIYLYGANGDVLHYSDSLHIIINDLTDKRTFKRLFDRLRANDQFLISDLEKKNKESIMYLCAPIRDKSGIRGMVVLEIPITPLNKIMHDNTPKNGLGKSGESYLVGEDLLMRSKSRFIDNSVLSTKVESKAVLSALEGNEGTDIVMDYRNIEVLSSYSKLGFPGLNWVILAEIDTTEALQSISDIRNSILMISTLIALLLFIYAFIASARFTSPIIKLKTATLKIGEGDFNPALDIKSNDEIGELVVSFRKMLEQLKKMTGELKKERFRRLRSVIDGQEIERQRLSRELHDGLGQQLIALKLKMENIKRDDQEQAHKIIREVKDQVDLTIEEIKRMSNNLMPVVLTEFGIANAISDLCDNISDTIKINVKFIKRDVDENMNKKTKTYIYRITQEALNNAVKYSEAQNIFVYLIQSSEYITLRIQDDGKGFDFKNAIKGPGTGLKNMQERAGILQGSIDINSKTGEGTLIVLNIPV